MLALDIYFMLSIIKCFMTSYTNNDQQQVKDFWKIAMNYLSTTFIMDIITWIPTQYIAKMVDAIIMNSIEQGEADTSDSSLGYILLWIKCLRIFKGFFIFNVNKITDQIQQHLMRQNEARSKVDYAFAEDIYMDTSKIGFMIYMQFMLSLLKLVLAIMNISFFFGMGWYTFVTVTHEVSLEENFFTTYGVFDNDYPYRVIQFMYFSFTTLATVGFGDYTPRSTIERAFASFILMFGVALFSYILGNLIEIIRKLQKLNDSLEEEEALEMFFGMIKRFNDQKSIEP